jgi:4-aminobutyrate aminotransferase-like enzyme
MRNDTDSATALSVAEIVARRDHLLGKGTTLFYDPPLHLVRGEGAFVWGADGRRYVDMYNNIPVVGHCNPRVVDALARQARTHNTHSRYLDEVILDYAERLLALHAEQIESVVFTCTGTEANEVAMQAARMATGGRGFICTTGAYHGHSDLVGALTDAPPRGRANVNAFAIPDPYRPPAPGLSPDELCDAFLADVKAAIDDFATTGVPFAGMLVCSILANEGLPDIPAGFMPRAAAMVREAGGLIIADEVQAGYARTGHWWGYEVTGFSPDIVVTGKPMGNGLPLAATAASRALVETFRARTRYFNTFASSPLQAAVGMAVLDEIEQRNLRDNVTSVGTALKAALTQRKGASDTIGDVRGHGLFIGVEMVKRPDSAPDVFLARQVINRLKDKGFLTSNAGAHANVVKIRPPLPFSQADAAEFLLAWDETIAELAA